MTVNGRPDGEMVRFNFTPPELYELSSGPRIRGIPEEPRRIKGDDIEFDLGGIVERLVEGEVRTDHGRITEIGSNSVVATALGTVRTGDNPVQIASSVEEMTALNLAAETEALTSVSETVMTAKRSLQLELARARRGKMRRARGASKPWNLLDQATGPHVRALR